MITYSSGTPLFQQSGGIFSSAGNVTFYRIYQTAGTFNAPSGTLTMFADLNTAAGGTFNANGGTIVINSCYLLMQANQVLNNLTINSGYNTVAGTNPKVNGTLSLVDGTLNGNPIIANGNVTYAATFDGGSSQIQFSDAATRTINLPVNNFLLGMIINNPNITITTSGAGASTIIGATDIKSGTLQQGNAALIFGGGNNLTISGGTFVGSSQPLNLVSYPTISAGTLTGGTGLIDLGAQYTQSGGTFSTQGDVNASTFILSGGTFNAPSGLMTVVADYTHNLGGTFNAGTGTVKFTGYNTFNCINQIGIKVTTETFNNLQLANSFCNQRYLNGTLVVNNNFQLSYGSLSGGRIRPLGTTTIDATYTPYSSSTVVEYVTPNTNFVIANPATTVSMMPVEMNAANSTLTSSGAGRINFNAMTLTNGTLNQPNAVWDFSVYPGYTQSGGIFNGSAAQLNISNGINGNILTGGTFSGGTGLINGGWGQTGGTFSTAGGMNVAGFTLSGGVFNAPLGTLDIYNGFSHTSGGTFNSRTGTVQTSALAGVYGIQFDVNSNEIFNNLKFNGTYNSANHIIAAGDTLTVNGTLSFNGRGVSGGSIVANGDVIYSNSGGYQNATTLVKFQDTATRTVTFCNDGSNCGGAYILPTLVNNPNITINSGVNNASLPVYWQSLNLQQGTVNAGNNIASFAGDFTQSGGTYNGGATSNSIGGNFTLSGGDFNASTTTSFAGNYTHTAGGNFNYGTGTVVFGGSGGTIDVNATENFNNITFQMTSSGNTKTISAGDTLIANGTTNLNVGYVNGGTLEAKGNLAIGTFSGGTANVTFSGAGNQIFTNSNGYTPTGIWTVNKPSAASALENSYAPAAPTTLLISGNIGNVAANNYPAMNVIAGNVVQTGNFNTSFGSLTLASGTTFVNEFSGALTLAGNVLNNGYINLDGNGSGCPQADSIFIRSSSTGTQRSWNGTGNFRIVDTDVRDQAGTALITVYSGTDSGNNGTNWVFNGGCLAPTAATVTIGGRITNSRGRGILRVRVLMVDSNGTARAATTNSFGYYRFNDVAVGQTITVSIVRQKHVFDNNTQILNVVDDNNEVNFVANQ